MVATRPALARWDTARASACREDGALVTDGINKCVSEGGAVLPVIPSVVLLPQAQIARRTVAEHVIKGGCKLM